MWLVVSGTYTLDEEGKVTGCMRTSMRDSDYASFVFMALQESNKSIHL